MATLFTAHDIEVSLGSARRGVWVSTAGGEEIFLAPDEIADLRDALTAHLNSLES